MIQIGCRERRVFSLEEAREILPLLIKITEEAQYQVRVLTHQLQLIKAGDELGLKSLESRIQKLIEKWQSKVESLGAEPKGLWIVDFDHGSGYFCWKFPEPTIFFCHGYQDGFQSRRHVGDVQLN